MRPLDQVRPEMIHQPATRFATPGPMAPLSSGDGFMAADDAGLTRGVKDCGLMFSGQGSQRSGMGYQWYGYPQWEIVGTVSECTGYDVANLLLHTNDKSLQRTDLAQISIFTMSIMAFDYITEHHMLDNVNAAAGHSLGEFTALVASGALSLRTGANLVASRGSAMRDAARLHPGTMAAILGAEREAIETITAHERSGGEQVWIANMNGPLQYVISGTSSGVDAVARQAKRLKLKVINIPVGAAFHSPLMASARPALRAALQSAKFDSPTIPVVANVDARPYTAASWSELAERQLTEPVQWDSVVNTLVNDFNCRQLLEIGPTRVLPRSIGRGSLPKAIHLGYPGDFC